jgi:hypothetical protein
MGPRSPSSPAHPAITAWTSAPGENTPGLFLSHRRPRQWRPCTTDCRLESSGTMSGKAKPPTDRAAEQADYKTWLADAVAELQRKHNVNPAIIPARVWRHLYIQGRSPQKAADQAVSAYNRQSSSHERLWAINTISDPSSRGRGSPRLVRGFQLHGSRRRCRHCGGFGSWVPTGHGSGRTSPCH